MNETVFILIKPDHVDLAEQILSELDQYGHRVKTVKVENVPRIIIENHYSVHKGKHFFRYMIEGFTGRQVVLALYEGEEVITKFVKVIGDTDPSKASKDSIRGRFSNDSLEEAIAEGRMVRNVIHRSDSPEEVRREINVWKQYL